MSISSSSTSPSSPLACWRKFPAWSLHTFAALKYEFSYREILFWKKQRDICGKRHLGNDMNVIPNIIVQYIIAIQKIFFTLMVSVFWMTRHRLTQRHLRTVKVKTILLGGVKVEIFYIGKVKVDTDHPRILSYESESRNFLPQNRKVKVCHWGKVKVKCCYMRKLKVTKVPFSDEN